MSEKPSNYPEQRRYTRVRFDCAAELSHGNDKWQCTLVDISLKGVLLECMTDHNATLGDTCKLDIYLDENATTMIHMNLVVAHIRGKHLGCSCTAIDSVSISHLRRLIELNLGDPKLVEHELLRIVGG